MLDAFKKMGTATKLNREVADELQGLVTAAREERQLLSRVLNQIPQHSTTLLQVAKTLEGAQEQAGAAVKKIGELTTKLGGLDERIRGLEDVEQRISALKGTVAQAEQTVEKLIAPDGDLQKHRTVVQHLSSQALETRASLEVLKKDQGTLEELREQLRRAQTELEQSAGRTEIVKGELDQLRSLAGQLNHDFGKLKDTSREARETANATMESVKEVEKKLGPLAALQELSKSAEERLAALNALAEHVSQKVRMLENQRQTIEHALVESNRLNELIWNMDLQIAKLTDGAKQAARAEETVERIEKLVRDTGVQLDAALKAKDAFAQEISKLERDKSSLADFVRSYNERLAVERKEFDAFDQRMKALQTQLGETEKGMETLAAKERNLAALNQKVDGLAKQTRELLAQADELQKKQLTLESLQERLSVVDELSKRAVWQLESLNQGRQEIDKVRKEIQEVYKSHAGVAQLRDKLAADRVAFEAFLERAGAFGSKLPDLDAKMDTITGKLSIVEEGTQKATNLVAIADELDRQMARVAAQQQFVERVDSRINSLNAVTLDVERKLEEQLNRRGEVETLKSHTDSVALQVADAQQKLEQVGALQNKLVPLITQFAMLKSQIEKALQRFKEAQKEESQLADQERRLTDLVTASRALATEVDERLKHLQGLTDELNRASTVRDELLDELGRVQARQRDIGVQTEASEDQIKRLESILKQLDHRRMQLTFAEKKIATFELHLAELKHTADDVERQLQAITAREGVVDAVRKEIEEVHEISGRSKADLQHVVDHRTDLVALKTKVDDLVAALTDTEQRMVVIEARRKVVDDVQFQTASIVNMVEDVRINLETLTEQKAVIDHVVEGLAKLSALVQEGQTTLRALQAERELAERIERGIRQLRAKSTPEEGKRPAATA